MSVGDPVFVASAFGGGAIPPTVGLGIPLYVVHATFSHPVTGADTPLPPHHWALVEIGGGTLVSVSGPSDPVSGICVINDVADPGPGPFTLGFVPAPADVRQLLIANDEAWVDLGGSPLPWAAPQPDRTQLETRNLFRIPAWTTQRKATRGGGFKDWPSKASADSQNSGVLTRDDVFRKSYGTPAKPWEIAIDLNWVHATLKYFFFDWGRDKEAQLPAGLIVDAVPTRPDSVITRFGAGTTVQNTDSSIRMLIEADKTHWEGMSFQFRTPDGSRVDLTMPEPPGGAKDTRLVSTAPVPTDRNVRNLIPTLWHSLGHRCKVSAGGKDYGNEWTHICRFLAQDGQTDVTAEFRLEDVVLVDNAGKALDALRGRPTLFDHFLKIIDPVASRPHQSDTTADRGFIIADKVFTIGQGTLTSGQKRLELSTRLVHLEGTLFDLRDDRVVGDLGRTPLIGARAAVQNAHPFADYTQGNPFLLKNGLYELHFIDVPGVQDPVAHTQLGHMLVYMACQIDEKALADLASGPNSKVDKFFRIFTNAAERWSQGCPGVPASTKDYRIVAKDTAQRTMVIRPRMFFGQVFDPGTFSNRAMLKIGFGKAGSGSRSSTSMVDSSWWSNRGQMTLFDSDIDMSAAGNVGSGQDSDGFSAAWHTLAHELGHAMGLPDDYGEELTPDTVDKNLGIVDPRVLGYGQKREGNYPSDYRPFYGDKLGIMNENALPRLRYYWHHVTALGNDPAFQSLAGKPFRIRHEGLGGGLEFVQPIDEMANPFQPLFFDVAIPGTFAKCALFPVGQDEGTVEAMWAPPTATTSTRAVGARFDGILVVRARVCFGFDGTVAANEQWKTVADKFWNRLYDDQHRERIRFSLTGGSKLSRIAIVILPLCKVGPADNDDFAMNISNKIPIPPNPFDAATVPSTVDIDIAHFNVFSVLRAILGLRTSTGSPSRADTSALTAPDFAKVAALVDTQLGDPPGTRTVVAL